MRGSEWGAISKVVELHVSGPKDNLGICVNGLFIGRKTPSGVRIGVGDVVHVADLICQIAWVVQGSEKYIRFSREQFRDGYRLFADVGNGDQLVGFKPNWHIDQHGFVCALKDIGRVNVIDASACKGISSIDLLTDFPNLWSLDLRATKVSDLSALSCMSELRLLSLSSTRVSDISPLRYLGELRALDLRYTMVSDISPLAGLKKLKFLNLEKTQVSGISVLAHLENLRMLVLSQTKVSVSDLVYLKKQLPDCKIF